MRDRVIMASEAYQSEWHRIKAAMRPYAPNVRPPASLGRRLVMRRVGRREGLGDIWLTSRA